MRERSAKMHRAGARRALSAVIGTVSEQIAPSGDEVLLQKRQEGGMSPHLRAVALPRRKGKTKVLEIEGVQKVFPMNGGFLPVLEEITFLAESGELICILGRSGCGKSTLLKIVAGFVPPSSGKVLIKGMPVKAPGPDRCVIFQPKTLRGLAGLALSAFFGAYFGDGGFAAGGRQEHCG